MTIRRHNSSPTLPFSLSGLVLHAQAITQHALEERQVNCAAGAVCSSGPFSDLEKMWLSGAERSKSVVGEIGADGHHAVYLLTAFTR